MTQRKDTTSLEKAANWLDGSWLKILSIVIPFFVSVVGISFYVGQLYANLNAEYDKIKMERECSERLNQEIDKARQLQDELTKERTDNLNQLVDNLKKKIK